MSGFLSWFFEFMQSIFDGFIMIFSGLFKGIVQIFNIVEFANIFSRHISSFNALDWVFSILAILIVISIWILIGYLIYLRIRRYIRLRKRLASQEDLFEEIADLHQEVMRLTSEKDRILALKVSQSGVSARALAEAITDITEEHETKAAAAAQTAGEGETEGEGANVVAAHGESRFARLTEVDEKYLYFNPPEYVTDMSLTDICQGFRNFACSRMHLFYDVKIIRCFFAGMASTKMLLLQGISGTGKTSLPYSMGKYFTHDATIASVQPSWRDRTELFGYFNEFTKKFNETEVLKRIYEASYNDDINIIILDEMNIARVEYYFAEMLSILEMPDTSEWKLELVPSSWDNDPKHLAGGKLTIPQNMWYVGTANNDDSTFSVSDKVYDRALTINLDAKGEPFDAPDTEPANISYAHLSSLFREAIEKYPVSDAVMDKISHLDIFIIEKLRIAFGNRIIKQLHGFVPVYVACGGTELDGVDYVLATKVFRKFESLNLSLMRDELKELDVYLTKVFGKNNMKECHAYLERLSKLY